MLLVISESDLSVVLVNLDILINYQQEAVLQFVESTNFTTHQLQNANVSMDFY